jgi:hypothetical protein
VQNWHRTGDCGYKETGYRKTNKAMIVGLALSVLLFVFSVLPDIETGSSRFSQDSSGETNNDNCNLISKDKVNAKG